MFGFPPELVACFGWFNPLPEEPAIRVTAMPTDTNPYGRVFGVWLMSRMGLAAGSLASRTASGKCVVVAANEGVQGAGGNAAGAGGVT